MNDKDTSSAMSVRDLMIGILQEDEADASSILPCRVVVQLVDQNGNTVNADVVSASYSEEDEAFVLEVGGSYTPDYN